MGGNGSKKGVKELSDNGVKSIFVPATIDNDVEKTDYSIGFHTAVAMVCFAVRNVMPSMDAHNRGCVFEVMGRHCGDIALYSGMAGGAESIVVPELPFNIDEICAKMRRNVIKGKVSDIIVLAEGVCSAEQLKAEIHDRTGVTIRTVKLGYIQRGGTPSMADRVLAARCADRAVELLYEDSATSRVIGIKNNVIVDVEIEEALSIKKQFNEKMMEIANRLSF